jgi:glycosyltransferase involved in cell wall biosynthesis
MIRVIMNGLTRKISVTFSFEILQGLIGVFFKFLKGSPLIMYTMDDTLHLRLSRARPLHPIYQAILKKIRRFVIKHTDLIITVDQIQTDWVKKNGARHAITIPFGIDYEPYLRQDKQGRQLRKSRIPKGKKLFGYVGGFMPHHGAHLVLDAAKIVLKTHNDVIFWMIGSAGAQKDRVHDKNIIFEGLVPVNQVASYIHAMDVCICPPITHDLKISSVSNKFLEYASCVKPIIGTTSGSIPRNITKWQCGLLTSPNPSSMAETIQEMISQESAWNTMGQNALQMIQTDYNWKKNTKRIINYILTMQKR